jgi:hypothetical protein
MAVLQTALERSTVVVAVDPGKVMNRVWVSNGSGLLEEPVSLPVTRSGIAALEKMLAAHGGEQVIAIEATGSLHRAWAAELDRLHPGAIRLFAPSETKAARTQLGSGRFKTDDRDCAALTYLARQGAGRGHAEESAVEQLRAAVRHRRGLVADRKKVCASASAASAWPVRPGRWGDPVRDLRHRVHPRADRHRRVGGARVNWAAGGGRDLVVRHLARHAASWHVLHATTAWPRPLKRWGHVTAPAVTTTGCSAAGHRGRRAPAHLPRGKHDRPVVRVPLREVLAHADRRITAAEWQRIDQLVTARHAAAAETRPRDHYYSPTQRSATDNARITAGYRAMAAAEPELRAIIAAALTDQPRAGEQLDLFADLASAPSAGRSG